MLQYRNTRRRLLFRFSLAVTVCSGCGGHLPSAPSAVFVSGSKLNPVTEEWSEFPVALYAAAHDCQIKLYKDARQAKKSHKFSTAMTIIGGSTSVAGGATSAILGATIADDSEVAKAGAIASATIGAVAGVVTVLSKVGTPVETSTKMFGLREAHWRQGRDVVFQYPEQAKNRKSAVYRYAIREFNVCASSSPSSGSAGASFEETEDVANTSREKQLQEELLVLNKQLANERGDLERLEREQKERNDVLLKRENEAEEAKQKLEEVRAELEGVQGESGSARRQRDELRAELAAATEKNDALEEQNEQIRRDVSKLSEAEGEHEGREAELQRRIECLQARLDGNPEAACDPADQESPVSGQPERQSAASGLPLNPR